jgi:hypothetical protein
MNLQKIIRNAKITLGLTWYNFISEKPDISIIMNGLGDDKYIPVASPPVISPFKIIDTDNNSRNKYFTEMAEQEREERALRQTLSAIGFPNGYDFGASVIETHYAPDARISTMPSEPQRMINNNFRYSPSLQLKSDNKHYLTRLLNLESQGDSIKDSDKPSPTGAA